MKKRDELSKIEARRMETEKRLAKLKDKEGNKKPIRQGSLLSRILFPVISIVAIIALAVWLAFSTGLATSFLKPVEIGDRKVSMKEFNFNFNSVYATYNNLVAYNMAPGNAEGKLDLTANCSMPGYENKSWRDYVIDQTVERIQETDAVNTIAKEHGYAYGDEDDKKLDEMIDNIRSNYASDEELQEAIESVYGVGTSIDEYKEFTKPIILNERFESDYPKSYEISQEAIDNYYKENADNIDVVSYRQFIFHLPNDVNSETATEEEKKAAQDKIKADAEEMLNEISDGLSFRTASEKYASDEEKSSYITEDISLKEDVTSKYIAFEELKTWLYDSSRKPNDKIHLTNGSDEYVVLFEGRERLDNKLPTVRHILIGNPDDTSTVKDEAKLDEDAKLAREIKERVDKAAGHKADEMKKIGDEMIKNKTARESERYENIHWGTMDKAFQAWIFDPSREHGDVGYVQSNYGYHVIYFEKNGDLPEWEYTSSEALRAEKYQKEKEAFLKEERFTANKNSFALKYIG